MNDTELFWLFTAVNRCRSIIIAAGLSPRTLLPLVALIKIGRAQVSQQVSGIFCSCVVNHLLD